MPSLRRVAPGDGLPSGYADGWTFVTPDHGDAGLPRLAGVARLTALGGTLTRLSLSGLAAGGRGRCRRGGRVCRSSALGCSRGTRRSCRCVGQVVVVRQFGLKEWWLNTPGDALTYIVPRADEIVVGGTEEHDEWSRTPDPGDCR